MKKITVWHPSTCNCEIQYEWDTDVHQDFRAHRVIAVKHCEQNHPKLIIGEHVEGSEFHKDHIRKNETKKVN